MRHFLTFLLVTGLIGMPGCLIRDCDDTAPYWNIKSMEITFRDFDQNELADQVFEKDTLVLDLFFENEFLAHRSTSFIYSTMALQKCPSSGERGMKDGLVAIEVTSDTALGAFEAGELLNPLLQGLPYPSLNMEEWIFQIISQRRPIYTSLLFFTNKPEVQLARTFTVKLIFNSGREVRATSDTIMW